MSFCFHPVLYVTRLPSCSLSLVRKLCKALSEGGSSRGGGETFKICLQSDFDLHFFFFLGGGGGGGGGFPLLHLLIKP